MQEEEPAEPTDGSVALSSAPMGSEQGRLFYQHRLAIFARLLFFLDAGFLVFVNLIALFGLGWSPRIFLSPAQVAHLVSVLVLAKMWQVCRRPIVYHPRALLAIDAGGVVLVGFAFGLMGAGMQGDPASGGSPYPANFTMMLALTHVLVGRAVLVPSTPRRTTVIGAFAALPVLGAAALLLYRSPEIARYNPFRLLMMAGWGALAVIVSTVASRVIYGLRKRVREATQLGQYTLLDKIGEGGMGAVYRARHAMLRRPTAIKLLPADKAGEKSIARFEREVQLTSMLTHPNTVAVYDYGRTPDGVFYYAMEYLDGVDLDALVRLDGPQPPGRVVHILTQVCGALGEAHAAGLIHRDIKPANILLCRHGGVPDVAKVVDFGLVKPLAADVTTIEVSGANALTGTPMYLSPEAIKTPEEIDARADLYALGAVGYYLLTGQHVFSGRSMVEVCGHHLHSVPQPPAERLGRPLPDDLCDVLLQCLAKDPARRPSDARALRAALRACEVPPWREEDAAAWWQARGKEVMTGALAASESAHGTVAVDPRGRAEARRVTSG